MTGARPTLDDRTTCIRGTLAREHTPRVDDSSLKSPPAQSRRLGGWTSRLRTPGRSRNLTHFRSVFLTLQVRTRPCSARRDWLEGTRRRLRNACLRRWRRALVQVPPRSADGSTARKPVRSVVAGSLRELRKADSDGRRETVRASGRSGGRGGVLGLLRRG
jgi:hypothetical protein